MGFREADGSAIYSRMAPPRIWCELLQYRVNVFHRRSQGFAADCPNPPCVDDPHAPGLPFTLESGLTRRLTRMFSRTYQLACGACGLPRTTVDIVPYSAGSLNLLAWAGFQRLGREHSHAAYALPPHLTPPKSLAIDLAASESIQPGKGGIPKLVETHGLPRPRMSSGSEVWHGNNRADRLSPRTLLPTCIPSY